VLVNQQGRVEAIVIGVGGFLGIGQRDVAVPFDAIRWQIDERSTTGSSSSSRDGPTSAASGARGAGDARTETDPGTNVTTRGSAGIAPVQNTRHDQNRDYPARAVLAGASKEQLNNAPEFRYAQ
jgi:hypothetical protein